MAGNTHHHHSGHAAEHLTPHQRLSQLMRIERGDLYVVVIYTLLIGLLTLAVPLAAQALVNTIAAGVLVQPLVVLTLGVFGALLFAGVLRLLKFSLLEKLQQRLFARTAFQLAEHLPRIDHDTLTRAYAPQLANRFFDVVTLQKMAAKLLFDGPAALLQVFIALLLMSLYAPYLLAFAVMLLLFTALIIGGLGFNGLPTSIEESLSKYRVADWLTEMTRCERGFKMNAVPAFSVEKTDGLVMRYLKARRAHFRILFRQALGNYLLQAFASAGVLAIGGWLVINRQLTLGQVVAAEIVVIGALEGIDKLIRLLESYYDLLTSLDKIGHVTDMPGERRKGRQMLLNPAGARVACQGVRFSYDGNYETLKGLDLTLEPGERVSLVGESGAGKSTFAAILCGLHAPSQGNVLINGMDVRDANLDSLRRVVALVGDSNEVFEGTIEENILLGRNHIPHEDLQWALDFSQFTPELTQLPQGLQTQLVSEGRNLSRGQLQRLLFARAVVGRPQLLILDEGFTGIDEHDKIQLLDGLYDPRYKWTIIDISHDPEVVLRSRVAYVLAGGKIVESDAPRQLMNRRGSEFARLFPSLGLREVK